LTAVDIIAWGGTGLFEIEGLHHGVSGGDDEADIDRSTIDTYSAEGVGIHYSGAATHHVFNSRIASIKATTGVSAPEVTIVNTTLEGGAPTGDPSSFHCGAVFEIHPLAALDVNCQ